MLLLKITFTVSAALIAPNEEDEELIVMWIHGIRQVQFIHSVCLNTAFTRFTLNGLYLLFSRAQKTVFLYQVNELSALSVKTWLKTGFYL